MGLPVTGLSSPRAAAGPLLPLFQVARALSCHCHCVHCHLCNTHLNRRPYTRYAEVLQGWPLASAWTQPPSKMKGSVKVANSTSRNLGTGAQSVSGGRSHTWRRNARPRICWVWTGCGRGHLAKVVCSRSTWESVATGGPGDSCMNSEETCSSLARCFREVHLPAPIQEESGKTSPLVRAVCRTTAAGTRNKDKNIMLTAVLQISIISVVGPAAFRAEPFQRGFPAHQRVRAIVDSFHLPKVKDCSVQ